MAVGTLYIVGTPLGNLEDIGARALRVLGEVALVAAEDTRTAQKLWARFGLAPRTVSLFDGNERSRAEELVARLLAGDDVAVISEAGMPGVSDPGERVVARAAAAGVRVVVVPGPSAVLAAIVGSGLPAERFTFLGFLPPGEEARTALLARLRWSPETLVLYESPGRTGVTLGHLATVFGDARRACIARELTKVHEEFVRGTLAGLIAHVEAHPLRGEVTLVVEGAPEGAAEAAAGAPIDVERAVDTRLASGQSPREIAAALALLTGVPRRRIYQLALARRPRSPAPDDDDEPTG